MSTEIPGPAEVLQRLTLGMKRFHETPPAEVKKRSQHPKGHSVVQSTFRVHELPEEYRVGLFANPLCYAAWIRFSNGRELDDRKPDIHGMAIKLLEVPGEKLAPDETGSTTLDFVLTDHPVFFARDAQHFLRFLGMKGAQAKEHRDAKDQGKSEAELRALQGQQMLQLATEFPVTREFFKTANSPLTLDYFSQTPYQFGSHVVKYFVKSIETPPTPAVVPDTETHLVDEMKRVLTNERRSAQFEFGIEIQTNPDSMPIDDGTAVWNSPLKVVLATITIPAQEFGSSENIDFGEELSFTPWRTLREHEPLGSLNLARRQTYVDSSMTRHELTNTLRQEPNLADFNLLTLTRFYDSFSKGDYRGMQACLHPEVEFEDIGFKLRGKEVAAMWHMIVADGIQVTFRDLTADARKGNAHWECDYEFRLKPDSKGHPVHNKVVADFEFEGGLIRRHKDICDFWNWFEQAMGLKGNAAHLFDFLEGKLESLLKRDVPLDVDQRVRSKVKETAGELIAAFIKQHPEYRESRVAR